MHTVKTNKMIGEVLAPMKKMAPKQISRITERTRTFNLLRIRNICPKKKKNFLQFQRRETKMLTEISNNMTKVLIFIIKS